MKNRFTVIAGFFSGVALMLAVAPAMAHADVAINIGGPGFYVQSAPVYVSAPPVYVQPRPLYVQPQSYYMEQQYQPARYARDWRGGYRHRRNLDRDGDGVPNRFDRQPNNPYRN